MPEDRNEVDEKSSNKERIEKYAELCKSLKSLFISLYLA